MSVAHRSDSDAPIPFGGTRISKFKGNARDIVERSRQSRKDLIEKYVADISKATEKPAENMRIRQCLERNNLQIREEDVNKLFNQILSLDMLALRAALQKGKYNAVTVAHAYTKRAIQIDKHLNCITEMIKEIMDYAEQMDKIADVSIKEKHFSEEYPLYGLPFSIKSNFHLKKYVASVGLTKFMIEEKDENCELFEVLKKNGAIPICLTNVPQGLLAYVTSNPVYGTTKNPWDLSRTPGGSSGGEAALVAAGGVAFGIGNDLVGSLRIPAAFCGLVSLKPSQDTIFEEKMHPGPSVRGSLGLSCGFFTKTVQEQELLYNLVIKSGMCKPNGTNNEQSSRENEGYVTESNNPFVDNKRKIAYFTDDRFNRVAPSNERAVLDTVENLKREFGDQYEFVEFKWPNFCRSRGDFPINSGKVADMLFRNVMPDNGKSMYELYENEPWDSKLQFFIALIKLKWRRLFHYPALILFNVILTLTSKGIGCLARAFNSNEGKRRENEHNTVELRQTWEKHWIDNNYHAMLCPAFITPAQPFEYPAKLATGTFSTGLFNMLDVPAGVVPVAPVKTKENDNCFPCVNINLLHKWQKDAIFETDGLPNAVQVVTLPGKEADCLNLMKQIEQVTEGVQKLQWKGEPLQEGLNGVQQSGKLFERIPLKQLSTGNASENEPSTTNQTRRDENIPSTSNYGESYESQPSTSNIFS